CSLLASPPPSAVIRARDSPAKNIHQHGKARALIGANRQPHAAQSGLGIGVWPPLGVERITEGDFLAAALGAANLSARGNRRRHVEQERGMLARRRTGCERIGAAD